MVEPALILQSPNLTSAATDQEPLPLLVDPVVSRAKFNRELEQYRQREEEYQRRGWWMLKAEFPEVFIVFVAPRVQPVMAVFGAKLDFSNYDIWAPSVQIVHPLTRLPFKKKELPTPFLRRVGEPQAVEVPGHGPVNFEAQPQSLMAAFSDDEVPFVCLPGVREYHDHPAHSGDLWLSHRDRGEGTLFFLIEKLSRYGVEFLVQPNFQVNIQMAGFSQSEVPS